MNDSHFTDEQIAVCAEALNSGQINGLNESIKMHLKECDACAQQVAFIADLSDQLSIESDIPNKKRILKLSFRIAAAAVILVLIGIGFFSKLPHAPNPNKLVQNTNDTSKILPEKALISQNELPKQNLAETKTPHNKEENLKKPDSNNNLLAYTTHADMEKLVDRFQTGTLRGNEIEIKTASVITAKADAILLQWVNQENQELIIEIFNNKGEKVFEKTTTEASYKVSNITEKGLYYWKLINADFDLIFCGKLNVE